MKIFLQVGTMKIFIKGYIRYWVNGIRKLQPSFANKVSPYVFISQKVGRGNIDKTKQTQKNS